MRVIAGTARGVPLKVPPGRRVRPTSERLRGALFNGLGPQAAVPVVLDLFAGTGALGIEALSRGAGFCVFVERDPAVVRVLAENLQATGFAQRARIVREDVFSLLPNMGSDLLPAPAGLVLADPPYGRGWAAALLRLLDGWCGLAPGACVAVEHSVREEVPEGVHLRLERRYRHGDAVISLFRHVDGRGGHADGPVPG